MTNEEFKLTVRKLGKLLTPNGGMGHIEFEPSSYDDVNDIPVILYQGVPYIIKSIFIDRQKDELVVNLGEGPYSYIMFDIEEADFEDNIDFDSENISEILREAYYATSQSWEIGEFEDFLTADIKEYI